MEFTNYPPTWNAEGTEPTTDLKNNGFTAGYKPPATYFNYLFNTYMKCINEIQSILSTNDESISYLSDDANARLRDIEALQEDVSNKSDVGHTHSTLTLSLNGDSTVSYNGGTEQSASVLCASNPKGTGSFSLNRKSDTTVGYKSIAMGNECSATAMYAISLGDKAEASGAGSVSAGYMTKASNNNSVALGSLCESSGTASFSVGNTAKAVGDYSVAFNEKTNANGQCSTAMGEQTTAQNYQLAIGYFTNQGTSTHNGTLGKNTNTIFCISNGSSSSDVSNAMRVNANGQIYATNASITAGADYAEYFEWADGNPNGDDRVGYFVTFDEKSTEKIRISSDGDYILGIVSGMPSVIGNGDEEWKKRYILDEFGRYIPEEIEYETEEIDSETGKTVKKTVKAIKWKENPDYDSTKEYIPRDQRKEWSAIGMVGVLSVYDDGTCQVNGYCKCGNNGVATAADSGYRVIKRVSENIVKVVLK